MDGAERLHPFLPRNFFCCHAMLCMQPCTRGVSLKLLHALLPIAGATRAEHAPMHRSGALAARTSATAAQRFPAQLLLALSLSPSDCVCLIPHSVDKVLRKTF